MDRNAGVLVRIGAALGGDRVLLLAHRPPSVDHAVLEDGCCVAEDEVHGAVDVAFFVELPLRVDVEGVLVALEAAAVEDGEIGARPEGHSLVVLGTSGVAECDALGNETVAGYR